MVYLDYSASSPVEKGVLDIFYETNLKYLGNPNSPHKLGEKSKLLIQEKTEHILKLLKINDAEIVYTSGATEANNLAIKGIGKRYKIFGKHILVSSLEHNSIMAAAASLEEEGFNIEVIPVNKDGLVNINVLKQMIRKDTILVSVTAVDSELGLKQPIEEIGAFIKKLPNVIFHTDATQAVGKVNINYDNVDLITFAPHKFYGLNGIGALVKKKNIQLKPIIDGGLSTTVYRAGTPDLASIVALDKALEIAILNLEARYNYVLELKEIIINKLKEFKNIHINSTEASIPYMINFSVKGIKSQDLVKRLEEKDIIVSFKTSCCPIDAPSKLVYALTHDKNMAKTSLRVSLGHLTTKEEIDIFLKELILIIEGDSYGK